MPGPATASMVDVLVAVLKWRAMTSASSPAPVAVAKGEAPRILAQARHHAGVRSTSIPMAARPALRRLPARPKRNRGRARSQTPAERRGGPRVSKDRRPRKRLDKVEKYVGSPKWTLTCPAWKT